MANTFANAFRPKVLACDQVDDLREVAFLVVYLPVSQHHMSPSDHPSKTNPLFPFFYSIC